MIMQGCVISCGTVVFIQKSRNLSRLLLTNNDFYCGSVQKISDAIDLIILESFIAFKLNNKKIQVFEFCI